MVGEFLGDFRYYDWGVEVMAKSTFAGSVRLLGTGDAGVGAAAVCADMQKLARREVTAALIKVVTDHFVPDEDQGATAAVPGLGGCRVRVP